uniref:Reverse transcriptase/retrotransposon-derived protein RNase H-like domain-containing protein n=1 Tax=Amphimedon queenslandica TaxID=400682 RepID=A0A1X7U0U6_AMPQE
MSTISRSQSNVVSADGIATNPTKVEKVLGWPIPKSRFEVQQFLGLANLYRRFIPQIVEVTKPLHRLTEKNCTFQWTTACQQAFHQNLASPPVLAFPDFIKEFILDTDASDNAMGATLSQIKDDDTERVIACASQVLTKAERHYSVTRKEILAPVTFTSYFVNISWASTSNFVLNTVL